MKGDANLKKGCFKVGKLSKHIESASRDIEKALVELRSSDLRDSLGRGIGNTEPESSASDPSLLIAYLSLAPSMKDDILLKMLLRCVMWVVKAGGAGLTLHDPEKNCLVFRAALGDGSENIVGCEVPREGSVHGLAFATGEVQSRTPIHRDVDKKTGVVFRNVLVAPLIVEGEPIGTISAVNKAGADSFTTEDMGAFRLFSELAGIMIRQRRREQILSDMMTKGKKGKAQKGLPANYLQFEKSDSLVLETARQIVRISRENPELFPILLQTLDILSKISRKKSW